jgi:predicted phosphodiesterase
MKLIHISDTHVGRGENVQRFGMVVDDLLSNPPDVPENCLVVHTGDVIDSATEVHRLAGKTLLKRLGERYRILLCPGNHDYGDAMAVNEEAAQKFREVFSNYIFQDKPPTFPVLHEVGGEYAFIGLDSNAAELSFFERWFAEGHLGTAQLAELDEILSRPELHGKKIIVYLHHHPFSFGYSVSPDVGDQHFLFHLFAWLTRPFRRLKDAYSFCQIVRDRAHMLLFGHMHFGLDCSGDGKRYGIPVAFDGGSSTCTENDSDRVRYRIIDLRSMTYEVRTIML